MENNVNSIINHFYIKGAVHLSVKGFIINEF